MVLNLHNHGWMEKLCSVFIIIIKGPRTQKRMHDKVSCTRSNNNEIHLEQVCIIKFIVYLSTIIIIFTTNSDASLKKWHVFQVNVSNFLFRVRGPLNMFMTLQNLWNLSQNDSIGVKIFKI